MEKEEILEKYIFLILENTGSIEKWLLKMQNKFKLHLLFDTTVREHKKIASIY